MGYWNYRVVRRQIAALSSEPKTVYGIHEAYYGIEAEDGDYSSDIVDSITEAAEITEDSIARLRETLECMLAALDEPVLDYETMLEIVGG